MDKEKAADTLSSNASTASVLLCFSELFGFVKVYLLSAFSLIR